jgi:hypothetical protein
VALTQSPHVYKEAFHNGVIYRLPVTAERPDAVYKVRAVRSANNCDYLSILQYTNTRTYRVFVIGHKRHVSKEGFAPWVIYRLPVTAERPDAVYKVRAVRSVNHYDYL